MKDLTRSLLAFVLIYGTRDKAKFQRYAMALMESYPMDDHDKSQLVDYAYEFFHGLGERMNSVDVISRGVRSGVSDVESKLETILEKLEALQQADREGHSAETT